MSRPLQFDGRVHGVVVGCRRADGRLLHIRRSAGVVAPLKVCFPGGAIEVGEAQPDAVIREMREELGARVVPGRCVWTWHADDRPLTLWGWTADLRSATLTPNDAEVAEVLWLTAAEARARADTLPNHHLVLARLEAEFGSTGGMD